MERIAVAFLTFEQRVSLLHRDDKPEVSSPNTWGLIGGHIEEGETPEEGLKREVKEETDLTIGPFSLLKHTFLRKGNERKEYFYFHSPLHRSDLSQIHLMDEGQALEFKTLGELLKLDVTFSLRNFIEEAGMQMIKKILA